MKPTEACPVADQPKVFWVNLKLTERQNELIKRAVPAAMRGPKFVSGRVQHLLGESLPGFEEDEPAI